MFGNPVEGPVFVTIQNGDYRDATIYANWSGAKSRVGFVVGKTSETFEMQWRNHDLQIEVDFVGGGGFRSERLSVWAGEHIDLVILPQW